jgi:glycosyltransferase involved in cell wall biosynthesis
LSNTVRSIRETAGDRPEVIVVDDQSSTPVVCEDANRVIHNRWQCGCAPSRHIGAMAANGTHLLFIDAHSRFQPGWYEKAMQRLDARPTTVYCATCIGLDFKNMDMSLPTCPRYHGASFNFYGADRQDPTKMQVFEAVWNNPEPEDDAEIAAVMGACYFVPRAWYLKIDPLRHIRYWGMDEPVLSLKTWFAGGDVRLMKNVEIGHKFWNPKAKPFVRKFFAVPMGYEQWNKLWAIHTLMPRKLAETLEHHYKNHENGAALNAGLKLLRDDWSIVATEQANNARLFTRGVEWLANKFGLKLP